jgi:hypothetical protein
MLSQSLLEEVASQIVAIVNKSELAKLIKSNPLEPSDRLPMITLALREGGYLRKALAKISSVTSLPRSPQKTIKSLSGQSSSVGPSQTSPLRLLLYKG